MKPNIRKPMMLMLISLGILFGLVFFYKFLVEKARQKVYATYKNPIVTVSTTVAKYASWQPEVKAVGSLRATLGVNVTAQLGGMIQKIYFTPGSFVKENTVLVQQNADPNIAQLQSLEAQEKLAQITYTRNKAQYKAKAVSAQELDQDEQNLKNLQAQVAEQKATVEKLTIRAPFTGKLGISQVNPGQYLNPGDSVVTLQSLDPIYCDFYLPQQYLSQLSVGQIATVVSDTFPDKKFIGKITTINPIVDTDTRNVEVEATIPNSENLLNPGMYVNTVVTTNKEQSYLTVPQSAITYNPYGNIAYTVSETNQKQNGQSVYQVHQVIVTTGETRGDQVIVMSGIKAGDKIVTSGQLKLHDGGYVLINNQVEPSDNPSPVLLNQSYGSK